MEYTARPCEIERMRVAYPNISASGTEAATTRAEPRWNMPPIRPPRGTVKTDHLGTTCIDRVYVVGDASRDVQFAVVAAAEGAKAGVAINRALQARSGLKAEV